MCLAQVHIHRDTSVHKKKPSVDVWASSSSKKQGNDAQRDALVGYMESHELNVISWHFLFTLRQNVNPVMGVWTICTVSKCDLFLCILQAIFWVTGASLRASVCKIWWIKAFAASFWPVVPSLPCRLSHLRWECKLAVTLTAQLHSYIFPTWVAAH